MRALTVTPRTRRKPERRGSVGNRDATVQPPERRLRRAQPDAADREGRAPREVGAVRPHSAAARDDRRLRGARADLRRGHAGADRRGAGDGRARLGAGARPRALLGAGAVPAHGPGDRRYGRLPDPAGVPGRGGDRGAPGRGSRSPDAGRRRSDHRGGHRPRGSADARQPDRRPRADLRAAVQGRRSRTAAGRRGGGPDRGRGVLARAAVHELRARPGLDVRPSDVQSLLQEAIATPVRGEPTIALEEVDADEVVVRIQATPIADADGPKLADEVLAAIGRKL